MKRALQALLLLAFITGAARADYLEVRRPATIKQGPQGDAPIHIRPPVGSQLPLLNDAQQTNGYYRVAIPPNLGASAQDGWIYRTLVRRFPGIPPTPDRPELHTEPTAEEEARDGTTQVLWPERHDDSPEPHTIFGTPLYQNQDADHNLELKYSGFTVYWDDVVLGPRWTAIKLTGYMADAHGDVKRRSRFTLDKRIESSGLEGTKHKDYNNLSGSRKWARGHIVQFDDARGWGPQSGRESFSTSNVVPQIQAHNGKRWLALEQLCTEFARDLGVVWIYSGPIYADSPRPFEAGRKVPAPIAFYKIAVSPSDDNLVNIQAFRMPHREIESDVPLSTFLVSVDAIEEATGIDFLPLLPDAIEENLESVVWGLWPDL
jgi:DNA/RNA endonuclease G (NUC1)